MPTDKQQYVAKLNQLASRYGNLEDDTIESILRMLEETRAQINQEIIKADVTPAGQFQLANLQANIERLIADFERRADAELRQSIGAAYEFGGLSATEPLQVLGFSQVFYSPSAAQVNILQGFSTDLITGITADLRRGVDRQVRLASIGVQSPFDAMKAITEQFGEAKVEQGKMVVNGISAKAEMDVRTEMQTVFNLSNHSQMMDSASRIEGLLKRWIATGDGRTRRGHLEAHLKYKDNPIPVDEPYIIRNWRHTKKRGWFIDRNSEGGGIAKMRMPLDPNAPAWARIRCRCMQALIAPGIGVIGSSLDGRVGAMLKRAEEQ